MTRTIIYTIAGAMGGFILLGLIVFAEIQGYFSLFGSLPSGLQIIVPLLIPVLGAVLAALFASRLNKKGKNV